MKITLKTSICIIFIFFAINISIFAQNRFALVIGNNNYTTIGRLANPVNDATEVAARLRTLGYQVELKTNVGNAEMGRAINDYIQRLAQNRNNEGFFWFAGHGVQIDGENYLLPIDVDSTDDVSVQFSSYPVNRLVSAFERTAQNKVNIVVLDACRNNPFRNMPARNRSLSRGLSVIQNLPPDLFVIYSTAAGDVAADGTAGRRNSPFAEAFMQGMDSNDDISIVIRNITRETLRLTDNQQRPYQEGSIISLDYYSLNPRRGTTQPVQQEDATVYYNRGQEFFNARNWDRAIEEYTRAISINPSYAEAYNQRGRAYDNKREFDQALADWTAAHRLNPNEPAYVGNIGTYYVNIGDYERGIAQHSEAIRISPDAIRYSNRADAFRLFGDFDKAIEDATIAIRLDQNDEFAFRIRGRAHLGKRDYIRALNDLNESIRINPNASRTYEVRASVYRAQGRNDLADADTATANRLRAAGY